MTKAEAKRKATATGVKFYNRHYSTFVEYEYRGKTYEVEYPNDYSYCCLPVWLQHRDAQEKIDAQIEKEEAEAKYRAENPDWKEKEEAAMKETEDALDALFSWWAGEISTEEYEEKSGAKITNK